MRADLQDVFACVGVRRGKERQHRAIDRRLARTHMRQRGVPGLQRRRSPGHRRRDVACRRAAHRERPRCRHGLAASRSPRLYRRESTWKGRWIPDGVDGDNGVHSEGTKYATRTLRAPAYGRWVDASAATQAATIRPA